MGRKRVNAADTRFQPKKCRKRCPDDHLTRLPDDVLAIILSSLSLKEAIRTSILSHPWRQLWKRTSRLDFDATSALDRIGESLSEGDAFEKMYKIERLNYASWVDTVLEAYEGGPKLREFQIGFDFGKSSESQITRWLRFALERRVERLELSFDGYLQCPFGERGYYAFPEKDLLGRSSTPDYFRPLTSLCFKCVVVSGVAIESFVRNCPSLERLVIHDSDKLTSLEIRGGRALRHLEICACNRLEYLRVCSAPNLSSFRVMPMRKVFLENVPRLAELDVYFRELRCMSAVGVKDALPALYPCATRLEVLTLTWVKLVSFNMCQFPELPKLKKLVVEFRAMRYRSLIGLMLLVRASPYLQEFVVRAHWTEPSRLLKFEEFALFPHLHLKVVEYFGFYGCAGEFELIMCMLQNCMALERIIIDPSYHSYRPHMPLFPDELEAARHSAKFLHSAKKLLEAKVPHVRRVEVVVR